MYYTIESGPNKFIFYAQPVQLSYCHDNMRRIDYNDIGPFSIYSLVKCMPFCLFYSLDVML